MCHQSWWQIQLQPKQRFLQSARIRSHDSRARSWNRKTCRETQRWVTSAAKPVQPIISTLLVLSLQGNSQVLRRRTASIELLLCMSDMPTFSGFRLPILSAGDHIQRLPVLINLSWYFNFWQGVKHSEDLQHSPGGCRCVNVSQWPALQQGYAHLIDLRNLL